MATSEFHTVYNEAFLSATGKEFKEAEHQGPLADIENELLDKLTSPVDLYLSHETRITHPNVEHFTDEDIILLARTRYLGRSIINAAKDALMHNPFFAELLAAKDHHRFTAQMFSTIYEGMHQWDRSYSERYQKICAGTTTEDMSHVASPLNLREWPNTPSYVNCLGTAINMTALAELGNRTYFFGNEIRHANHLLSERHYDFRQQITRLHPDFFENPRTLRHLSLLEKTRTDVPADELHTVENLLISTPRALQPTRSLRDFHHFVLVKDVPAPEDGLTAPDSIATQVDPYSLTLGLGAVNTTFDRPLDPWEVMLRTNYTGLSRPLRSIDNSIADLRSSLPRLRKILTSINCKSSNGQTEMFTAIERTLLRAVQAMQDVDPDSQEDQAIKRMVRDFLFTAWRTLAADFLATHTTNPVIAAQAQEIITIIHAAAASGEISEQQTVELEDLEEAIHPELLRTLQYNSIARQEFVDSIQMLPTHFIVEFYVSCHRHWFRTLEYGSENVASEFGDTDTMVGAMYLNHYATTRKDGKINIARELARVIPSQLLWYAAAQDVETDERHVAVGEVIQSLKPHQLHPLVEIARQTVNRPSS